MNKNELILCICLCVAVSLSTIVRCSKDDNTKPESSSQSNKSQVAYTHVNIIDGISSSILFNQTLIIDTVKGTIEDRFTTGSKALNTTIVAKNMDGKIMMPGLIEGHFHLASGVREDSH